MTACVPCERVRDWLGDFVDGELLLADQVAVEAHLRSCRVCVARVDDLHLIGASIRFGVAAPSGSDQRALMARTADVLVRTRVERASTLAARVRDLCQDMRLVLPALGATVALVLSMVGSLAVLRFATEQRPESLAAMIESVANNPLKPDEAVPFERPTRLGKPFENRLSGGISLPRVIGDGAMLERVREDDGTLFAVATVVNREGRITNYELLRSRETTSSTGAVGRIEAAVLDAVRQSRFEPAQTPGGRPVAVNMVWVMIHQTVKGDEVAAARPVAPPAPLAPAKPVPIGPPLPADQRSSLRSSLTAA